MMSTHAKTGALLLACSAAAMLALATPAAAASSGACSPINVKYLTASDQSDTAVQEFRTIPQTTLTVTVTEDRTCVIVRFSALTSAPGLSKFFVQALMDGDKVASPGAVGYSAGDFGDELRAHSFDFVFENVTAGAHKIQMQYRTNTAGRIFLADHSMIIQY